MKRILMISLTLIFALVLGAAFAETPGAPAKQAPCQGCIRDDNRVCVNMHNGYDQKDRNTDNRSAYLQQRKLSIGSTGDNRTENINNISLITEGY